MTEIQPYQAPQAQVAISDSALVQWARDASEAHRIAQSLSRTSFVSTTLRGKPEEITAAILTGQEIGLEPMSALRSIDVIQGTPALRANALRGLVQSRGHEVWIEGEPTALRAVVCGQRKGSDKVQKSVWTMDRATRLGLASKDNWRKQPEAMLVARATAEVCRLIASDVLLGLPYAVEELEEASETPAPKAKAKRKTTEPVQVEPPSVEPDPEPVESTPEPVAEAPALDGWPEVATPPGDDGE